MISRAERGGRNMESRNARDCGVRTLAIAANIPYQQALDMLAKKGRVQGTRRGVTYWGQIKDCLRELGFEVEAQVGTGTLRTAGKNYPAGTWVIYTRDHFTVAHDGVVYDWAAASLARVKWAAKVVDVTGKCR